jgi:hypothetical protein
VLSEEHGPEAKCVLHEGKATKPITLQKTVPNFFRSKLGEALSRESRISFSVLPFSGYDFFNNAGHQRNAVFHLVETEWAAFVDDDDTLGDTFVADLLTEWQTNPLADAIIFRMSCEKCFAKVIPRRFEDSTNFALNYVGISFALRRDTVLRDERYWFRDSCGEDFDLLSRLRHARMMLVISPSVLYFVNDYKPAPLRPGESYRRVVIKRKEGGALFSDELFNFEKECRHQRKKFRHQYEGDCVQTHNNIDPSSAKKCQCRPCGNFECYRQRYPDTASLSEAAAAQHYKSVGILEGRTCMCDSVSVYGDGENDQRALRSGGPGPREQGGAGTKGRTLGRPNVACDWDCYRYRHPDLALFDDKTAAAHYIESGAAEGRLCTCEFSEAANGQVNAKYEYMLQSSAFQVTLLSAGL